MSPGKLVVLPDDAQLLEEWAYGCSSIISLELFSGSPQDRNELLVVAAEQLSQHFVTLVTSVEIECEAHIW